MKPLLRSGACLALILSLSSLAAQPPAPKILHASYINTPVSLDWGGHVTMTEAALVMNLCEGLFTYDDSSKKISLGIAESVTRSKDLKEYTFKLRADAKWSDGRQIYAQDFVDAWLRVISPQSTSIYTYYFFDIVNAREFNSRSIKSKDEVGIKAVSDRVLVVKLKHPNARWEETTAFWPFFPIRKDLIEKFGANWWRAGTLVSSGPFVFDSSEQGKKMVFKRNPYYSHARTNLTEVDFDIIDNQDDSIKNYDAHKIDFTRFLPFEHAEKFIKRSDFVPIALQKHYVLALNSEKYPISDREFRLALLSAIDPSLLLSAPSPFLHAAGSLIPSPLPGAADDLRIKFDLKAAQRHLKNSGVVKDQKVTVRILTNIYEPFNSIAKSIHDQLEKNLGISVELSALQNQEYEAYLNMGDYSITLVSWTPKVHNSQDYLLPYSAQVSYNLVKLSSPFYDQWMNEGIEAISSQTIKSSFTRAEKSISIDEALVHPLFFETSGALVSNHLRNLYFTPMGTPSFKHVILK